MKKFQFKTSSLKVAENTAKKESAALLKRLYVIQSGKWFYVDEVDFVRAFEVLQAIYENGKKKTK